MRTSKGKAIYIKRQKLDQFRKGIKSMPCPRCQRVGWITANGPLYGNSPKNAQDRLCRGHRFACGRKDRKRGCARSFCVLFSDVLYGFSIPTYILWCFFSLLLKGYSLHTAWLKTSGIFSLSSGYRLFRRIT